jgi:hypothetical protein
MATGEKDYLLIFETMGKRAHFLGLVLRCWRLLKHFTLAKSVELAIFIHINTLICAMSLRIQRI